MKNTKKIMIGFLEKRIYQVEYVSKALREILLKKEEK